MTPLPRQRQRRCLVLGINLAAGQFGKNCLIRKTYCRNPGGKCYCLLTCSEAPVCRLLPISPRLPQTKYGETDLATSGWSSHMGSLKACQTIKAVSVIRRFATVSQNWTLQRSPPRGQLLICGKPPRRSTSLKLRRMTRIWSLAYSTSTPARKRSSLMASPFFRASRKSLATSSSMKRLRPLWGSTCMRSAMRWDWSIPLRVI